MTAAVATPAPSEPAGITPVRAKAARFEGFDGLRAIAAIAVVVHHSSLFSAQMVVGRLNHQFTQLDVGVAVFFLISGYLLYRPFVERDLLDRAEPPVGGYLLRRAARIFPAYWLALTAIIVVGHLTHGRVLGFGSFSIHGGAFTYARYYLLVHIYRNLHEASSALSQAWTLAVEITFYVFLPAFAALLRSAGRACAVASRVRLHLLVLALMYLASTAFRVWCFYGSGRVRAIGQYWLPANLDLFALGMAVAVVSVAIQVGVWPARVVRLVEQWPAVFWAAAIALFYVGSARGTWGCRPARPPVSRCTGTSCRASSRCCCSCRSRSGNARHRRHPCRRLATARVLRRRVIRHLPVAPVVHRAGDEVAAEARVPREHAAAAELRDPDGRACGVDQLVRARTAGGALGVPEGVVDVRRVPPPARRMIDPVVSAPAPVPVPARVRLAVAVVYAVLLFGYVVAVLGLPFTSGHTAGAVYGVDSARILAAARHAFWAPSAGPAAYMLLVQACARRITAICAAQALIYAVSWLWAADELGRVLRHRVLRIAGPLVLLALSLTPELMLWTVTIGTEALSIALVMATVAALLFLLRARTGVSVALFTGFVVLDAFARDTNLVIAATVAGVAAVIAIRRPPARAAAVTVALVCVLASVVSNRMASGASPPRWYYPLQDVVVVRVLPRSGPRHFFVARGMPVDANLLAASRNYFGSYQALETGPDFAAFRKWLRTDGLSTYEAYLLQHPAEVVRQPWNGRHDILEPTVTGAILVSGGRARPARVFGVLGAAAFWRSADVIVLWTALAAAAALWLAARRRSGGLVVGALMAVVATGIAHAVLAYFGDALEVGRHTITADAQWRAGLWMLTFALLDQLLVTAPRAAPTQPLMRRLGPLFGTQTTHEDLAVGDAGGSSSSGR